MRLVFSAGPGSRRTAVIVPLHNYEQLIEQTLDIGGGANIPGLRADCGG
jgi:hypothetical protein